jgi:hypothetical protein
MTDTPLDQPVAVALALIDQRWPSVPALSTIAGNGALTRLEDDPRYLVGRLQQAINVLMAPNLAPADPMTLLLSQAISDALSWRLHDDRRPCPHCGDEMCPACSADWDQADRYHELARALGAVANRSRPAASQQSPQLQDVMRACGGQSRA